MKHPSTSLLAFAVAACAAIVGQVSLAAGYPSVSSPPPMMDPQERALDPNDVDSLRCLDEARKRIVAQYGVLAGSERVSRSDTYGYVYRYTIVRRVDHGSGGRDVRTILVLWTTNCKTFRIATYPTFELPHKSSE